MTIFETTFGRPPALVAEAPGRVNLIGEHTDYNEGYVLPMAIPQTTRVTLTPRADRTIRVASAEQPSTGPIAYEAGREARRGDWVDYVQGITWALGEAGVAVGGADVFVSSRVPLGAGLSSSASLEVALLRAFRQALGLSLSDVEVARLAHRGESGFVGAPVGLLDPMACSLADDRAALFLDTRSLAFERIALPDVCEVVVIDSGVAHSHSSGDYRLRRAECEEAARALGVHALRDVDESDLARVARLPDPLDRRARHVVTEDTRVLAAVEAMRAGVVATLGELFNRSHASLRDDFAVSTPDVDRLVALLQAERTVFGARMTGGGFGGAVVALVQAGEGARVATKVARGYDAGGTPRATVLVAR